MFHCAPGPPFDAPDLPPALHRPQFTEVFCSQVEVHAYNGHLVQAGQPCMQIKASPLIEPHKPSFRNHAPEVDDQCNHRRVRLAVNGVMHAHLDVQLMPARLYFSLRKLKCVSCPLHEALCLPEK